MDIKSTFGQGGAGLSTPDIDGVSLVGVLRDIATDLNALNGLGASIGSADPTAVAAAALADPLVTSANATDTTTVVTLANEIKGDLNTACTLINQLLTTAGQIRTLAIELKDEVTGITISSPDPTAISAAALADPLVTSADATDSPTAVTLANEMKGDMNVLCTLVNQIRTTIIESRTLIIEIKTEVNAAAPFGTMLTQAV
jgi:hypothetical protein